MIEVTSTEFAKRFSQYRLAAHRQPVAVTHHSRITEVLVSKEDFDEYMRLKSLMTRALPVTDLSEAAVRALSEAEMDSRHEALNALLDE